MSGAEWPDMVSCFTLPPVAARAAAFYTREFFTLES